MSSSRRDPWVESMSLKEAMDNLLEEHAGRPRAAGQGSVLGLAVDLRETGAGYVLTASVPGVKAESIAISVLGDTVRIRGERREEPAGAPGTGASRWLIRERHFGPFDRSVKLPDAVAAAAVEASIADGVLTVTLPKANDDGPRTIAVRPASGARHSIGITGGPTSAED